MLSFVRWFVRVSFLAMLVLLPARGTEVRNFGIGILKRPLIIWQAAKATYCGKAT